MIAVMLFVYFLNPSITVFRPFPPPITTILGPSSYTFLLKINDLIFAFAFLPCSVDALFASIIISKERFCINTTLTTIAINPSTKIITVFPSSKNVISSETKILAIP